MYYPTIRGRGTYLSSSKPYTPGQEKSAASSKPWIIYNHLRPLHYNYCFMKPTFDFIRYDYFCILYRTRGTRINGGRSSGIWSPDWYTRSPCQLLSYLQKGPLLCLDIGFGFDFVLAVRRGNLCPINRFVVKGFFLLEQMEEQTSCLFRVGYYFDPPKCFLLIQIAWSLPNFFYDHDVLRTYA